MAAATVSTDIEFVNSFTPNLLYLLCENSSLNSANFTDRVLFFALILKSFYPSQKIFVTFMINSKAEGVSVQLQSIPLWLAWSA